MSRRGRATIATRRGLAGLLTAAILVTAALATGPGAGAAPTTEELRQLGEDNLRTMAARLGLSLDAWNPRISKLAYFGKEGGHGPDQPFVDREGYLYLGEAKAGPYASEIVYVRELNGKRIVYYQGSREWVEYLKASLRKGNAADVALAARIEQAQKAGKLRYLLVRTHPARGSTPIWGTYKIGDPQPGWTSHYQRRGVWHNLNGRLHVVDPKAAATQPAFPRAMRRAALGLLVSAIGAMNVALEMAQPYVSAYVTARSDLLIKTELDRFLVSSTRVDEHLVARLIIEDVSDKPHEYYVTRVWVKRFDPAEADRTYWTAHAHVPGTDVEIDGWPLRQTFMVAWTGEAKVIREGARSPNTLNTTQTLAPHHVRFGTRATPSGQQALMLYGGTLLSGPLTHAMPEFITRQNPLVFRSAQGTEAGWAATVWFEWPSSGTPVIPGEHGRPQRTPLVKLELTAPDGNTRAAELRVALADDTRQAGECPVGNLCREQCEANCRAMGPALPEQACRNGCATATPCRGESTALAAVKLACYRSVVGQCEAGCIPKRKDKKTGQLTCAARGHDRCGCDPVKNPGCGSTWGAARAPAGVDRAGSDWALGPWCREPAG